MRWRSDVLRLRALGCMPPDLTLSYRALESIFGIVFDQAEPQLHMRWIQLKNNLGLPHIISQTAFQQVSEFADAELSALVLMGGTSLNHGLPLTENQKKRLIDLKEGEKKRAAKAVDAPAAEHVPPDPYAARFSNPLTTWAILLKDLQNGECRRGVNCRFQHDGFPMEQNRCFTCKSPDHSSKECKCPGGGADPQRVKHWEEYRARKLKAEDNPSDTQSLAATGNSQKGKGKGKSKGKRNGKDNG